MINVSSLIDDLGGNAAVSRSLGDVKPSAISEMKRRGSIPPRYWKALIRLAAEKGIGGVTADALLDAHTADHDGSPGYVLGEHASAAASCHAKAEPADLQAVAR